MFRFKKIRKKHVVLHNKKATDVLYFTMCAYHKEHRDILTYLVDLVKERNKDLPQLKALYNLMTKAGETAIDCAHKLAPYQTPKLESIEVKSQTVHQFVMKAPQTFKSVDEWAKQVGASEKDITDEIVKQEFKPPVESIHDFDADEDELETQKRLN